MSYLILDQYDSDEYFVVTTDNILEPLGVQVIADSRYELIPKTRDIVEEIPGMHGEIDFGSYYGMRLLELHVAIDETLTPLEKMQYQRTFAQYLDATKGYKKLIFMDDPSVVYEVKVSGSIDFTHKPTWFDFTIPFKVKPFLLSAEEHNLIGSGYAVNGGTFESPIYIEFPGPLTNPSVSVGSNVIAYISSVTSGNMIIVDTNTQTAYISGIIPVNSIDKVSGDIDYMLPPQISVAIIPSVSTIAVKWYDRWL